MALKLDDDPVLRLADIAVSAIVQALPAIRAGIIIAARKELSGDRLYMPKALSERKEARNEAMRADRAAGLSLRAIARKHHVDKATVGRALKGNG